MKKTLIGGLLAVALMPIAVSALSISDIQAQIQALLARVNELRAQLPAAEAPGTTPGTAATVSRARFCDLPPRVLQNGVAGDDVRALQEFLAQEGHFNREPTGYFGPVTAEALRTWQLREGIVANAASGGVYGARSQQYLSRRCGGWSSVFDASPRRGAAPLTVTFSSNIGGLRPASTRYQIDFGDGTKAAAPECFAPADACVRPGQISHTYSVNGTYTARLLRIKDNTCQSTDPNVACAAWVMSEEVIGTVQIVVGGETACTFEYAPVCGAKPVVCVTTPCNPVPTTYANRCAMNQDGATFLYEGACRSQPANPADDPLCRSWSDGCNTCGRTSPGGPGMCTLMACVLGHPVGQEPKPYCISYFDSSNRAPVVSSFSGPTTLAVNQTGTWTIRASDPENQALSYSIDWGETFSGVSSFPAARESSFVQTTTFTHSYAYPGVYTVAITVRDASGQTARTTTTVRVGGSGLSCYSGGMSYPEGTRRTCIDEGGGLACIADAEYVCRSGAWAIEGGLQYPIACTMDARQCPDGSYVGRTGPNCQFVCPGGVILN